MKKMLMHSILLLVVFALFQNSYASSPYISYEVTEIRSDGLVVRDSNGNLSFINKNPGDIKVGDLVRYDSIRNRLKKSPWQLAKIIKMTDSAVTLQIGSGEKVDLNMHSKYRTEFKVGDQVQYNPAKGQIMKSSMEQQDEER